MNIGQIVSALASFFTPVVLFFSAVTGVAAFIIGAISNPQGLLNQLACNTVDMFASLLPSTPNNLKIGYLIDSIASSIPMVGRGVITSLFTSIAIIFTIRSAIAIYKLIPFKAT